MHMCRKFLERYIKHLIVVTFRRKRLNEGRYNLTSFCTGIYVTCSVPFEFFNSDLMKTSYGY